MKRNHSLIVWGTLLLVAGIFLILGQIGVIRDYEQILVPGGVLLAISLAFHLFYFFSPSKNEGLLVPGGILLVYGLMFLAPHIWPQISLMGNLWPLFLLGPALGLFEMYVFSRGRSGSMIPVFILTVIGGGMLLYTCGVFNNFSIIVALLLIGVGAACIINAFVINARRGGAKQPEPNASTANKTEDAPK